MNDAEDIARLKPQIMYVDDETYDWLVARLDETDDEQDYPKLKVLFQRPSPFTKDCE